MSSLSHQSETGRPATKKRSADPERGGSRKAKRWPGVPTPHGGKIHIWTGTRMERHFWLARMRKTTLTRDIHGQQRSGRLTRGTVAERYITEQHRLAFMARAFLDAQPLCDDVPHQARVARIRMCHARADFEAIINIVDNWRPELKIRDMEKGPEQDNLN
jgi:hypothetical protein